MEMVQWEWVVMTILTMGAIMACLWIYTLAYARKNLYKFIGEDDWEFSALVLRKYDTKSGRTTYSLKGLGVPNWLGFYRIAAAPAILAIYHGQMFGEASNVVAMALWLSAILTDWFDGRIARKWDMETAYGRKLDVVADKCIQYLPAAGLAIYFVNTGLLDRLGEPSMALGMLVGACILVIALRDLVLLLVWAFTRVVRKVHWLSRVRAVVIAVAIGALAAQAAFHFLLGREINILVYASLLLMAVVSFISLVAELVVRIKK